MKKTSLCTYCQSTFTYCDSKSHGKFCSSTCSGKYQIEYITKPLVLQGKISEPKTLKNFLTLEHGYKCVTCGQSEWMSKPLSLHLDHIDGNSDNNTPDNIRLLCPNCHSQTETFSGRNRKNNKRSTYMNRYRRKKLVGDEGIEPPTFGM